MAERLRLAGVVRAYRSDAGVLEVLRGADLTLAAGLRAAISIPITLLGGAGSLLDMAAAIRMCGVIGVAAGSLFVFKGALRAVLINYPARAQKDDLVDALLE